MPTSRASVGDLQQQAEALRLLTLLNVRTQEHEAAVRIGRQALALQRELGAAEAQVETLTLMALACSELGLYQEGLTHSAEAIAGAARLSNNRLLSWAFNCAGITHGEMLRFEEGAQLLQRALDLARALPGGSHDVEFAALLNLANLRELWGRALVEAGQEQAGEDLMQNAFALSRRPGIGCKRPESRGTMPVPGQHVSSTARAKGTGCCRGGDW